jgi:hypothetical protein
VSHPTNRYLHVEAIDGWQNGQDGQDLVLETLGWFLSLLCCNDRIARPWDVWSHGRLFLSSAQASTSHAESNHINEDGETTTRLIRGTITKDRPAQSLVVDDDTSHRDTDYKFRNGLTITTMAAIRDLTVDTIASRRTSIDWCRLDRGPARRNGTSNVVQHE